MIQSHMQISLIPGRIRETCFSAGTDFAIKKSWAVFSKSISTAGVRSLAMSMGALLLVGSTVARISTLQCPTYSCRNLVILVEFHRNSVHLIDVM